MRRIGILGDIGSGKSYIAKQFGYPIFNADDEVHDIYKKNTRVFSKLKKVLPNFINSFPVSRGEISKAILADKNNLKKIVKIIHIEVRKKMNIFLEKNKRKKFVVLDIPLLLENKINRKGDLLIFIQSQKKDILKRLRKRKNFNSKLIKKFRDIQLPLAFKKKKSQFIIKNDFTKKTVRKHVNYILRKIK